MPSLQASYQRDKSSQYWLREHHYDSQDGSMMVEAPTSCSAAVSWVQCPEKSDV